jgi:hypothetical protein
MNESHYMFVYWLGGAFNNDLETLTLTVGIVRSFESVGSAVSFGLGAAHRVSPMANLVVAFVMFVICIPTTSLVVFEVPEHPVDEECWWRKARAFGGGGVKWRGWSDNGSEESSCWGPEELVRSSNSPNV